MSTERANVVGGGVGPSASFPLSNATIRPVEEEMANVLMVSASVQPDFVDQTARKVRFNFNFLNALYVTDMGGNVFSYCATLADRFLCRDWRDVRLLLPWIGALINI